ncbi:MAG: protein kinase [Myxococcota bacterium]
MSTDHDLTGVTLDKRYRLTRLMGEGGMGQVYEGTHQLLDHKVAVKVLLPRFAYDATFRERFLREAKAASKVRHPNVVQILDFGDTPNNSVYFVMEFLEGRDLKDVLDDYGPLPWPRAQSLLLQITSALAEAHGQRIIHRDVKPANCFVIRTQHHEELVKLLDFGIAKITADPSDQGNSLAKSLTGTGEVFGTARYMAPEQAVGVSNDPRVDVYSVGVMAYEMLTGRVPFDGPSTFHIITKHVAEPPRPPRELNPETPREVEALILRALAKRPEDRFGSMAEMAQALHELLPLPNPPAVHRYPPQAGSGPVAGHTWPQNQQAPLALPPAQHRPASGVALAAPAPIVPYAGSGSSPYNVASSGGRTEPQSQMEAVGTGPQPRQSAQSETLEISSRTQGQAGLPKGLVLGLAGIAIVLGIVLATLLTLSFDEEHHTAPLPQTEFLPDENKLGDTKEPPPAESGEPPNEISALDVQDESAEASSSTGATTEPESGVPALPVSIVDLGPSIEPHNTKPSNKPPPSKPKPKPKPKAKKPLTDKTVQSKLLRTFRKKCRSDGKQGQVKVSIVVGSNGRVLSKGVAGASGPTKQCLLTEAGTARFPPGNTRRLVIEASL